MRGHVNRPGLDGIVYSASGADHVAAALVSARSSLRRNAVRHVIFASPLPEVDEQEGLSLEPFEPSDNPYVDKIANMRRSPFERTIFLDADTFVTANITHMLELLDQYDLAASFAQGRRRYEDPGVPLAFCEFNTGVVAWRSSERTAAFMESWQETYLAWEREPPFPQAGQARVADQPAFRHCVWANRMRVMVLPPEFNYRPGVPGAVVGRVRVIHGFHHDYEGMAAKLNQTPLPRSFPAMDPDGNPRKPGKAFQALWPDHGSNA